MATQGKPRQSGILPPGRSGIPTPGRSRSASSAMQPTQSNDVEDMSRALVDAIKANDPAQHRMTHLDSQSSSPLSTQSGRRSVADRPNIIRPPERAKTPASLRPISRPASRHSDVHEKSIIKQYDIGDNVRIDSLGLEGVLRYLGEIEGKNGLWAGVELNAQFAGKGKNNGSVNGIRYFCCSEKCGVFVATTKLCPCQSYQPNIRRPSSVASSRSGRASTSSISGRITPSLSTSRMSSQSFSNERVTPSINGRSCGMVTPGITPSAKSNYLSKSTPGQKGDVKMLPDKITPGSRAAKYANMTAKQLSSRKENVSSPTRQVGEHTNNIPTSPSPISRTLFSPSRSFGSPFSTPKPSLNGRISSVGPSLPSTRGRSSHTPRGRIPSSVTMPPPASPASATSRSASLSNSGLEELTLTNLELQGKTLQDRISLLMTEANDTSKRPESPSSSKMNVTDDRISELQARLEALEAENDRLLSERDKADASKQADFAMRLKEERTRIAEERVTLVKDKDELLKVHEMTLADYEKLRCLQEANQKQISELEKRLTEQIDGAQQASEDLNKELANAATIRQKLEQEIQTLQSAKADLKIQNDELGVQVDELRLAGQETIALYEERLSIADSQRYDLESKIAGLEKVSNNKEVEPSLQDNHRSATEIDNEALRDQVLYLQKKIATMEDLLEDSRAASEKEEAVLRERMKKLKEKEESMKLELNEGKREVERVVKAEAGARSRVEEIEEALRESQVALENARAEIETLRAELANADGLQRGSEQTVVNQSENDLREEISRLLGQNNTLLAKIAELTSTEERKRPNDIPKTPTPKTDSSTPREEIAGLKHIVQELQKEHTAASQRIKLLESENDILNSETKLLQLEAERLHQEIQRLEENADASTISRIHEESGPASPVDPGGMRSSLKEQKAEVEQLRKRLAETETKHARTTHDLHKEISELEALVESKIYREDELEQEVERLREKLSKMKKTTKPGGEFSNLHHQPSSTSMKSTDNEDHQPGCETVCEICERPGHDIFTCDLLKDDTASSLTKTTSSKEYCEDCETWGHIPADCPHSQDVF